MSDIEQKWMDCRVLEMEMGMIGLNQAQYGSLYDMQL